MSQGMAQLHFPQEGHSQEVIQNSSDGLAKSAVEEATQIENDKQLIKSHPLFVLLELLFEKCERATRGEDTPTSTAYDEDIQEFVRRHETTMAPIFIENPEIDNLMIKAIQVLRIHLLELEKVNELCKDFCHRYITCLKGKMHSENLLRSDIGHFSDPNAQHVLLHGTSSQCMANTPNANVTVNQQGEIVRHGGLFSQTAPNDSQILQNENGIDGSTPLSQVGVSSPPAQHMHSLSSQQLYHLHHQQIANVSDDPNNRKTKRGVLPKHATEILRSWLFSHIVHPYPTEDEKRTLATQTNLTLLQVNNWFINARRRILQPMLDASNPEAGSSSSASSKTKKTKIQTSRSTDRFWPNSISSVGVNGAQSNGEDAEPHENTPDQASMVSDNRTALNMDRPSCAQDVRVHNPSSRMTGGDGYGGHSPDDLDHQQTNRLHHYSHNDVTMTSCAPVALSMVNN